MENHLNTTKSTKIIWRVVNIRIKIWGLFVLFLIFDYCLNISTGVGLFIEMSALIVVVCLRSLEFSVIIILIVKKKYLIHPALMSLLFYVHRQETKSERNKKSKSYFNYNLMCEERSSNIFYTSIWINAHSGLHKRQRVYSSSHICIFYEEGPSTEKIQ